MLTSTRKAVTLLVLTAAVGGAIGSLVTARLIASGRMQDGRRGSRSEWYIDLLRHELKLTDVQQDSVRAILRRHRPGMDSLFATLDTPMTRMREAIRGEIRTVLTPDQQQPYTKVTARLDAQRRERMKEDSTNR
jgi:Spy/CpxP family protein refolding chaperone